MELRHRGWLAPRWKEVVPVFSELVEDLNQAHQGLQAATHELLHWIRKDADLPFVLFDIEGSRADGVAEVTRLAHLKDGEPRLRAGILCVSSDTVKAVEQLNLAKGVFKKAVMAIRDPGKASSDPKTKIAKNTGGQVHTRPDILTEAMQTTGTRGLDLLRCYSEIRVLPSDTRSISYTWSKAHTKIRKFSKSEAVSLAKHAPMEASARDRALAQLAKLQDGIQLAQKRPTAPQLRANLIRESGPDIVRQCVSISGPVLIEATQLPRYIWRKHPDEYEHPGRLERSDVLIDTQAVVSDLNLFPYVEARRV